MFAQNWKLSKARQLTQPAANGIKKPRSEEKPWLTANTPLKKANKSQTVFHNFAAFHFLNLFPQEKEENEAKVETAKVKRECWLTGTCNDSLVGLDFAELSLPKA